MNVEGYNLDSLRKLVRDLQEENKNLRELLKQKNIPCESEHAFQEEGRHLEKLDPDQGGRIQQVFITDKMVQWFYSMFVSSKTCVSCALKICHAKILVITEFEK